MHLFKSQKGQVVVEYILLLVVGVAIALIITNTMVSRNPENPGYLIQKWSQLIKFIADDYVDQ